MHQGYWGKGKKENSKHSAIYKMDEETGKLKTGIALVGPLHCHE